MTAPMREAVHFRLTVEDGWRPSRSTGPTARTR